MKRISFLIATLLLFNFLTAQDIVRKTEQKTFFAGIHFSPDYSFRQLINSDGQSGTEAVIRSRNRIEEARFGFSTGVSFGLHLSSRLQFESGLFFSDRGYKTEKELLVYIPPVFPGSPTAVKHVYKKHFLDVPLRLIYIWAGKRLQLAPAGGLALNLLLNQRQVTYNYYGSGEVKKQKTKLQEDFRKFNLSVQLGVGLRYRLNNRILLSTEPVFRYGLFKSADTPVAEKLWTAGLNTGFYFSFNK
jgi:hypothetical protein